MDKLFITVPVEILRNSDLNQSQKFILSEIMQLQELERGCVAKNKHFAELIGITKENVSRNIKDLENKGYISIKTVNGSRNHERHIKIVSLIKIVNRPYQSDKPPLSKRQETKENRTINKTINKTIVPTSVSDSLYSKFLEFYDYRKQTKKAIKTDRPFKSMINNIGKEFVNEEHLIQCIDFAMDYEYQGVFGSYVKYQPKERTYRTPEEKNYYRLLDLKKRDPDGVTSEEIEEKRVAMEKSLEGIKNA